MGLQQQVSHRVLHLDVIQCVTFIQGDHGSPPGSDPVIPFLPTHDAEVESTPELGILGQHGFKPDYISR